MSALSSTSSKTALAIVFASILSLIAASYFGNAAEARQLAHLTFRAWAFQVAGLSMLTVGGIALIYSIASHQQHDSATKPN